MTENTARAAAGERGIGPNIIDGLILALLSFMLIFATTMLGAGAAWSRSVLALSAGAMLGLWLLRCAWAKELPLPRTWAWIPWLLFLLLVGVQLIPLGGGLLGALSPAARDVYAQVFPGSDAARPLSLNPYATGMQLLYLLTVTAVLLSVAGTVRKRWHMYWVILTLLGLGVGQTLYGLFEQFSGRQEILGVPRLWHLSSVVGTYANRNHFAGLLAMIVPLGLGLLAAHYAKQQQKHELHDWRALAVRAISQSGLRQLLLAVTLLLMGAGVLFSLSRGGAISLALAVVVFVLLVGSQGRIRRYSLLLLIGICALGAVVAWQALNILFERIELALCGQDTSWLFRVELMRCSIDWVRDYWRLGSGLGSFASVFPLYQSPYFGLLWAHFLHNDWMQLLGETGVVATLAFTVGLGWWLLSTARGARRRRRPLGRYVALGAVCGVLAILVHSFFDYNLTSLPSQGLVVVTLLGLGWGASRRSSDPREGSRGWWRLPLGNVFARVGVLAAAVIVPIIAWQLPWTSVRAAMYLKVYQVRHTERMGMTVLPQAAFPEQPDALLEAIGDALDPYAEIHYYRARQVRDRAEALVRARAEAQLFTLMGITEPTEEDRERLAPLARQLVPALHDDLRAELAPLYEQALALVDAAIQRQPTAARYHGFRTYLRLRLNPDDPEIPTLAARALAMAPHRPDNLARVGRVLVALAHRRNPERWWPEELEIDEQQPVTVPTADPDAIALGRAGLACLRRAIYSDPRFAGAIYDDLARLSRDPDLFVMVTPETTRAQSQLANRLLFRMYAYDQALASLDRLERLVAAGDTGASPAEEMEIPGATAVAEGESSPAEEPAVPQQEGMETVSAPRFGSRSYEWRSDKQLLTEIARRQAMVQGRRGDWEQRRQAVQRYRYRLRQTFAEDLAKANELRAGGRHHLAIPIFDDVLLRDWGNPQARLARAELGVLPGAADRLETGDRPLDHLTMMVIHNSPGMVPDHLSGLPPGAEPTLAGRLTEDEYRRTTAVVDSLGALRGARDLRAQWLRGAAALLAGDGPGGLAQLEELVARPEMQTAAWDHLHLAWYYLGRAREGGDRDLAIAAYLEALRLLPNLRPAMLRLVALDAGDRLMPVTDPDQVPVPVATALAALTPEQTPGVGLGGYTTFLGFTPMADDNGDGRPDGFTLFWQTHSLNDGSWRLACSWRNAYMQHLRFHSVPVDRFTFNQLAPTPKSGSTLTDSVYAAIVPANAAYLFPQVDVDNRPRQVRFVPSDVAEALAFLRFREQD